MSRRSQPSAKTSAKAVKVIPPARRKVLKPLTGQLDSPLDLEQHVPYRVAVLSNLLLVDRDPLVRDITDLGLKELRVLLNVGSYMPVRAADIAYQTRLGSFTVSRAVKTLLAEELIQVEPDRFDARVALLELTRTGKTLYVALVKLLERRAARITAVLSDAERASLLDMLGRLEDSAEKVLAEEAMEFLEQGGMPTIDQRELLRWYKRIESR